MLFFIFSVQSKAIRRRVSSDIVGQASIIACSRQSWIAAHSAALTPATAVSPAVFSVLSSPVGTTFEGMNPGFSGVFCIFGVFNLPDPARFRAGLLRIWSAVSVPLRVGRLRAVLLGERRRQLQTEAREMLTAQDL